MREPPPLLTPLTEALHPGDDVSIAPSARGRVSGELPSPRRWLSRLPGLLGRAILALLGVVTLIVALAVVATIPIVGLLSLGYLLEVSGRIARTGRLRSGFVGLRTAGVAGALFAGLGLLWLPLWLISLMGINAEIIAAGSPIAAAWQRGFFVALAVAGVAVLGVFSLVQWLRPRTYGQLRDGVWDLATARLPYYFWLGVRGFAGGVVWLIVPISLLAAAALLPGAGRPGMMFLSGLLRLLGGLSLMAAVLWLPLLQARLAAEDRFRAVFELRAIRRAFTRAPIACWLACAATLLFALPLYLLKIEVVPSDAAWLPSLLFVTFIFPARLLAGWAYARSQRREEPRHWLARWLARLGLLPVAGFYAIVIFFTQYTAWHGVWSMYEQHAFLLPVPFVGM